jgi:hypothetical protein
MPTPRKRPAGRSVPPKRRAAPPRPRETKDDVIRRLERRMKRLVKEHAAEREQFERSIAATKRAADRRLAVMMRELAELRHHEARAEALARLLAERDAGEHGTVEPGGDAGHPPTRPAGGRAP